MQRREMRWFTSSDALLAGSGRVLIVESDPPHVNRNDPRPLLQDDCRTVTTCRISCVGVRDNEKRRVMTSRLVPTPKKRSNLPIFPKNNEKVEIPPAVRCMCPWKPSTHPSNTLRQHAISTGKRLIARVCSVWPRATHTPPPRALQIRPSWLDYMRRGGPLLKTNTQGRSTAAAVWRRATSSTTGHLVPTPLSRGSRA